MRAQSKLKSMPPLLSDEDAEAFVATADLSEYDLSGFKPARFVLAEPTTQHRHAARKKHSSDYLACNAAPSY